MISQVSQKFLAAVEDDIPAVKFMKYRHFLATQKTPAMELLPAMFDLALSTELIGQYEQIHSLLKLNVDSTAKYRQIRDAMVSQANKLINESVNYESTQTWELLGQTYLRIGQIYFKYGEYRDAFLYYLRLFKLKENPIGCEQYYTQMALSMYYLNDYGQLSRFEKLDMNEKGMRKLVDLCIIKDLKTIQMNPKIETPFKTLIQLNFTVPEIMANRVISFSDLGFFYSMLSLAFKTRAGLAEDVKWSSKLENQFLKKKYRTVLENIQIERPAKCFHPLIESRYPNLTEIIKKRCFVEVVTSFNRCPYSTLERMTGISEGEALLMVRNNPDLPLLKDPISSAIIYKKNNLPLYGQVLKLYNHLDRKYQEELKKMLRLDDEESLGKKIMGGMGRVRSFDY